MANAKVAIIKLFQEAVRFAYWMAKDAGVETYFDEVVNTETELAEYTQALERLLPALLEGRGVVRTAIEVDAVSHPSWADKEDQISLRVERLDDYIEVHLGLWKGKVDAVLYCHDGEERLTVDTEQPCHDDQGEYFLKGLFDRLRTAKVLADPEQAMANVERVAA